MARDAGKPRKPFRSPRSGRAPGGTRSGAAAGTRPTAAVRAAARRARQFGAGVLRGCRAHLAGIARERTPTASLTATPPPYRRALGLLAVALTGACLGLVAMGGVGAPVGPVDTKMTLHPSLSGGTQINVSPLGALELRSHHAPVRLGVDLDQLDQERAAALIDDPGRLQGLQSEIATDVRSGITGLAVHSAIAVATGATALGLAVHRRPRRALAAGGLALALVAGSGAAAYLTWNPKSVLEPKFSGLLAGAPSVVGDARSIVSDFDVYQQELARLVTNVSKLYEVTSTLPAYRPDPSTTRVLHVSDIHLNPAAWEIIKSLVKQYDIDVVIDSGDTMDHGTSAENGFLESARDLGAPYLWVRGNHDSDETQKAVRELGNGVHVLDDGVPFDVAGLRVAGRGDPQFTPDRSVVPAGDPEEAAEGRKLAAALRAQRAAGTPVDIAVGHNPVLARQADGAAPLALAGHTHQRDDKVLPGGTRLMVQGTTGGGGLRAVEDEKPHQVAASVLYLDRDTDRLQAWDEITLGGLGLSSAEVTRRLPDEVEPGASPSPSTTFSPSAPPSRGTGSGVSP